MDKGKSKMVEDDKGKEEEERKKNTRNAPLRIGGEEERKEEEEEEDEKEVEDQEFDLSSLNYGLLGAIAAKKERDAAAPANTKKIMAPFFCGQTQKSLKPSDAKSSDAGVSSSKSGNPFSCFGGSSSKPKCSTDNQASPAIPPSSRPEQSSVPRGLFTYVRGRFWVTKFPDHVAAALASNVPLDQQVLPPPPRPVSPPLHPPPPPFNPLLRSSSNPETSSAPRGFSTFVTERFRVTRPIGAAAGADTDANPRPNTSATDLQSSTAAAAAAAVASDRNNSPEKPQALYPAVSALQPQHPRKKSTRFTSGEATGDRPLKQVKKKGTLVIIYNHQDKKLFAVSDTKLSTYVLDNPKTIDDEEESTDGEEDEDEDDDDNWDINTDEEFEDNRHLKDEEEEDKPGKWVTCYKYKPADLRHRVEEQGEKILSCDSFSIALAGSYTKAHPLCLKLRERQRRRENHSRRPIVRRLKRFVMNDKKTDFLLATPNDMPGSPGFRIIHLTPKRTGLMEGTLLCFGSGDHSARTFLAGKLDKCETDSEIINLLRDTIYHVTGEESTVGGLAVVNIIKVKETDDGKRTLTSKILKFPPVKILSPVTFEPDCIFQLKETINSIPEEVFRFDIIAKIEKGTLEPELVGQNAIKVRTYLGVTHPSFYQGSEYLDSKSYKEFTFLLNYNKDLNDFMIQPYPDKDSAKQFQEFHGYVAGRSNVFWDNDIPALVIC